jgi:micrococcal nuclease
MRAMSATSESPPVYDQTPLSGCWGGDVTTGRTLTALRTGQRSLRRLLALAALVLTLAATAADAGQNLTATVIRIVDGDTIYVRFNGHTEKVRYIGMNTPETRHPTMGAQPGGREATAVNQKLVEGKAVRLELDVQERDLYGRLLAYVYVGDVMVNAELVRLGYAQVMTIPPNVKYAALFVKLQREARQAARGLWGSADALSSELSSRVLE